MYNEIMDVKIKILKGKQGLVGDKDSKTTEINTYLFNIKGHLDSSKIKIGGKR
jgi:hypothetical protein